MAQLESVDRSLSRFRTASRSVKVVMRRDMTACSSIVAMIDALVEAGVVPPEARPENGRRLGENIYNSIKRDLRRDYLRAINVVQRFLEAQSGKFPRSVSLYQLSIVALFEAKALDYGDPHRPRRYYVTDELISLFPSAANIPNRVNVG